MGTDPDDNLYGRKRPADQMATRQAAAGEGWAFWISFERRASHFGFGLQVPSDARSSVLLE